MYQAIEAISKAGVIQPLEPVLFDENEHLVILRLSKTYTGTAAAPTSPVAEVVRYGLVVHIHPHRTRLASQKLHDISVL